MKVCQEMTACHEAMEADTEKIEPGPGIMQSIEECQEIPKGEAAVMPVGGLRKQRRIQSLAAEHRQKPKERTRGCCGSWKRVTVAGRRMTCHARVAGHRENIVRKDRTRNQAKHGTQKRQKDGETLWNGPECNNGIRD
jgi:hypothetical protein